MKHPAGIKKAEKRPINYGNRGMTLENDLSASNLYYLENDIAIIYKKPTPVTICRVDYPSRLEAVIREAYFKTPSTTDYNGIYKGKYIDFEAKETQSKSFPLANIHPHQIVHLEKIVKHGGISFLIVRFIKEDQTFLLETKFLTKFLHENTRKSIPISYFQTYGFSIPMQYSPVVPYLKVIDHIYFGG